MLPVCLGGLGISDPNNQTIAYCESSEKIVEPLTNLIHQQSHTYLPEVKANQIRAKNNNARTLCWQHELRTATELKTELPNNLQRSMTACIEKGASSWLSTLPIEENGFTLHKGTFRDALCLWYGWRPPHLSSQCVSGKQFTIEHTPSCS